MSIAQNRDDEDRDANWRMFRLEEPTFSDFTRGVFFGVAWCFVMWPPMFLDVLTKHG